MSAGCDAGVVTFGEDILAADLLACGRTLSVGLFGPGVPVAGRGLGPLRRAFLRILFRVRRAAGRFLLVVDDVWYPEQLKPLLHGGPNTVRLVTTRRRSVLPSDASTVDVDAMTAMEARGLLTSGLGEIPESAQAHLLGMTGRWPVLLSLINGAARVDVRDGAEPSAALLHIRDSLRDSGLTALDP